METQQHPIKTSPFFLVVFLLTLSSLCVRAEVTPGDIITQDNLAEANTLLTPSTWWMVERGMPMHIIATKEVRWPKAYQEATEKYHHQVRLSADGRYMTNYTAGCPFPDIDINDPLAGFRVMWNHEQPPYSIDNLGTDLVAELVNREGQVERTYALSWRQLMWAGRLYHEPKPTIPHNPRLRRTSLFGPYIVPHDLTGQLVLNRHYLTPDRADDTYVYSPELRRVRRIGANSRGGPLGTILGTDYDVDSFGGFNASIFRWTFRILSQKDILAVVHTDKYGDGSVWCAPRDGSHGILAALPCVSWEKRRVWVVEATPTGYAKPYAYSKRILYIDQEFFFPLIAESYDQRGELWKVIVHCVSYTHKPYKGYPANPLHGGVYLGFYQFRLPLCPVSP